MARSKKRAPWFRAFDGWWYGQVGKGPTRHQEKLIEGEGNGREARRLYKELLAKTPGSADELSSDSTLVHVCKKFLKEHSRPSCSLATHRWYRWFLKGFCRRYGKLRLSALKPLHVTEYLNAKTTWGPTTRNRAITCLKVAINWAVTQGILRESPIKQLKKPPMARRDRVLTQAERRTIARAIRDRAFKIFLFALGQTGARPGEIRKVTAAHLHASGVWVFTKDHKTEKKTAKAMHGGKFTGRQPENLTRDEWEQEIVPAIVR